MRLMARAKLTIFNQLMHDYNKNNRASYLKKKKNGVFVKKKLDKKF